jgi:GH24 family phage-related lysozyme (muramidase)
MTDLAEQLVSEEEGKSRVVYFDSLKLLTIGIGCLVDPSIPGSGLCDEAITVQFAHDSMTARVIAARFPHYAELNEVRQAVLISMAFQLTTKPLHWPQFMAALEARDYPKAAEAGRDSDWWRTQTHTRAERAMTMLETGQWVEHK